MDTLTSAEQEYWVAAYKELEQATAALNQAQAVHNEAGIKVRGFLLWLKTAHKLSDSAQIMPDGTVKNA